MAKDQKEKVLDDLKFLITAQILLVVIVSYMVDLPFVNLDGIDVINYTFPIAFLFLSIFLLKNFSKIKSACCINLLINIYLLNFGFFIISLYVNVHKELEKLFVITDPIYLISLSLLYFLPLLIFVLLLLSLFIPKKEIKLMKIINEIKNRINKIIYNYSSN